MDIKEYRYILIKFHPNDQRTFKLDKGMMNEDDELIVDEVNAEKKYKLTPFSQLKKLENCIREHQISGIDKITKVLHT